MGNEAKERTRKQGDERHENALATAEQPQNQGKAVVIVSEEGNARNNHPTTKQMGKDTENEESILKPKQGAVKEDKTTNKALTQHELEDQDNILFSDFGPSPTPSMTPMNTQLPPPSLSRTPSISTVKSGKAGSTVSVDFADSAASVDDVAISENEVFLQKTDLGVLPPPSDRNLKPKPETADASSFSSRNARGDVDAASENKKDADQSKDVCSKNVKPASSSSKHQGDRDDTSSTDIQAKNVEPLSSDEILTKDDAPTKFPQRMIRRKKKLQV